MFKKNTAAAGFVIGVFVQTADGAEKTTGTPTCKRMIDGAAGDCANAASYDSAAGVWKIDLAAADLSGDVIGLKFSLSDCLSITYTIKTVTGVPDANGKMASTLAASDVTGKVPASLAAADVTGKLPAALNAADVTGKIPAALNAADVTGKVPATLAAADVTGNLPVDVKTIKTVDAETSLVNNVGVGAFLDAADAVETGFTLRGLFRILGAIFGGKVSGAGTGTERCRSLNDGVDRVIATVDSAGNRTGMEFHLS